MGWSRAPDLGHAEFDRDHRQILAMFNLLGDALDLAAPTQAADLADGLLGKLHDHCARERVFLARSWDAVGEAARFHARLSMQIGTVRDTLETGDAVAARALLPLIEETLLAAISAERMAVHLIAPPPPSLDSGRA